MGARCRQYDLAVALGGKRPPTLVTTALFSISIPKICDAIGSPRCPGRRRALTDLNDFFVADIAFV
jgi:hypothetical protein